MLADDFEDNFDDRRPYVGDRLRDGQLFYQNCRNKFELKLGQWTDDASMALCGVLGCVMSGHLRPGRLPAHMWRLQWG